MAHPPSASGGKGQNPPAENPQATRAWLEKLCQSLKLD
jgi:hypothetical protein